MWDLIWAVTQKFSFFFLNPSNDKLHRCLPVICSIHSLSVETWSAVCVLSLIPAFSLLFFRSNSWVLLTSQKASPESPDNARKKGITSVYLHISMFKKREEKTQRSTEDRRHLRGCGIRKNKLRLEDQRENKPFLWNPPAWSHLTCTFGLKNRVMSQLPCASPRWPAFPALPPSSFYWPSC